MKCVDWTLNKNKKDQLRPYSYMGKVLPKKEEDE